MTKLIQLRGENTIISPPQFLVSGVASMTGDTPAFFVESANPAINDLPPANKFTYAQVLFTNSGAYLNAKRDIKGIKIQDYNGAPRGTYAVWRFDGGIQRPDGQIIREGGTVNPLTTFSAKFYWQTSEQWSQGAIGKSTPVVYFRENGTTKFQIRLAPFRYVGSFKKWNQPYICGATPATVFTNYTNDSTHKIEKNVLWRFEIQVQPTTPKIRVKIYEFNNTTTANQFTGVNLLPTLEADPAGSMACNEIVFGNIEPSLDGAFQLIETPTGFLSPYYSPNKYISNMEVHDDYTIGNSLATPYTPPLPSWSEWNGNSETPLTDSGIIIGGSLDSGVSKKNIWDFGPWYNPSASAAVETPQREIVANGLPGFVSNPGDDDHFVKYTLPYVGSALASNRSLDLYVPQIDGIEAPANGWPVIVWVHGGYWLGGSRGEIFPSFLAWCLSKGYAVASVSYVLATAFIGAPSLLGLDQGTLDFLGTLVGVGGFPITKPSWDYTENSLPRSGAARSGQFPSFFLDVKKATKYLQVNVAETYNLDPNKFVVTGHSAGGYNALAAATTRDLSLNGIDLTINNTDFDEPVTTNVIRHTGDDPIYAGAYSFCGPVSIQLVWDYDPTHPYYGMIFTQTDQTNPAGREGKLKATARSFMGAGYKSTPSFTGTSIPEFISANAAKCPPIGYCRGKYDYLIHWEHEQLLAQSCATNNVSYTSFANQTVHDFVQRNFPEGHFYNYLKSIGL